MKRSIRPHELKRVIVEQLFDEDILPDSCLEVYKPLLMEPFGQYEIMRSEIERELRLKELEAQKEELKAKKIEKELELKHETETKALELNAHRFAHEESIATKFDFGKSV